MCSKNILQTKTWSYLTVFFSGGGGGGGGYPEKGYDDWLEIGNLTCTLILQVTVATFI